MEPLFDHDFSGVRVHTDAKAAESARAVNADAYTVGHHITFAAGRYAAGSGWDRTLLAHELAHVVQQSRAQSRAPVQINPADHPTEAVAARAADDVTAGRPASALDTGAPGEVGLSRQQASPGAAGISHIEISCATRRITFHSSNGSVGYRLTECDVTDGTYDASVAVRGNNVTFNLGSQVEAGRRFLFNYTVEAGQPSPAALLGSQRQVRIEARSEATGTEGQGVLGSIPVTFVATEIASAPQGAPSSPSTVQPEGVPGYPVSTLGLGGHVLAAGDLSWLSRADAVRRVLGPEYWTPFVPRPGNITLDRVVEQLPRDLRPRIEAEIAAGQPLSWTRRGFTQEQLVSIPELIERLNRGGLEALTPIELDFLRRAAGTQGGLRGGSSAGSPLMSLSRPGVDVPLSGKQYRVRVEVPRGQALDLSGPTPFNEMGRLEDVLNVEEAEFLVATSAEGRITSVQRIAAASEGAPSVLLRYSGAIRWGGRLVFVAGLGLSAYHVAAAAPGQRHVAVGEELGGQVGGFAGTALGVGVCVGFGIATGGVGLFVCGLAGGAALGFGGSALGGAVAHEFDAPPSRPATPAESQETLLRLQRAQGAGASVVCPSCHALQREWEARAQRPSGLPGITTGPHGELSPADVERLRQWLSVRPGDPR